MSKSLRTLAIIAVLSLTATNFSHAERFGTNPHPAVETPVVPTTLQTLAYTVLIYAGV